MCATFVVVVDDDDAVVHERKVERIVYVLLGNLSFNMVLAVCVLYV
jgi:hypothetical protein